MAATAVLKIANRLISPAVRTVAAKFGTVTHFDFLSPRPSHP